MNVLHPGCARPPWWSPPVLWRRFKDGLASASAFSSIRARCPKKVRRRDLVMDESGGWLVMRQMSAFLTKSCRRMSRILRRHHWSIGPSIHCISALLTAQCKKIQQQLCLLQSLEVLSSWSDKCMQAFLLKSP